MIPSIASLMFYVFVLLLLTAGLFLLRYVIWDMPPLFVVYNTVGRDFRALSRFIRVKLYVHSCYFRNTSVVDIFEEIAKKYPNKTCFIHEDKKWTFQQVQEYSNQVANYFTDAGYRKGDEVALFMENRPEYVCIWVGLSKIGVVPALINTNLRLHALAHSINAIEAKSVIFNGEMASAVRDAVELMDRKETLDFYCLNKTDDGGNNIYVKSLETLLRDASKTLKNQKYKPGFQDKLFYIYTSGTTGLPKAAIIRHSRFIWIGAGSKYMLLLGEDDVFYNPLPLYHTAGGVLLISVVLMFGSSMVIRKKFSASNYWKEAIKHNATVGQYIGEICRYLLNQPKSPEDTRHSIRLMYGNGLRPQIWREFQARFRIQDIIELYGATEGNANIINLFGKIGSVGFVSRVLGAVHPVRLIKVNPATGEPIRNKDGLCIPCKPGEPGELVGKIIQNSPLNAFDGYANRKATEKKIIKDCFRKGDMAFLSGDILVMDDYGYLYFQDRTGDTFRWKGENVSTSEVEMIISKILNLATCVVYGVEVPGNEGKAGMVAIQSEKDLDMNHLYTDLKLALPSYAVPYFIRICKNIETTGTYKLKKTDLQNEGYNLDKISDPVFFLDIKKGTYVKLDKDLHNQILEGTMRM